MREVPTDTGEVHGPTVMAYVPWGWSIEQDGPVPLSATPHNPGLYARYAAIDLTLNNKISIDEWCKRNPDKPRPDFGWGVVRHGFGLQSFGDGYMTQEVATARAKALNQGKMATDIPNVEAA